MVEEQAELVRAHDEAQEVRREEAEARVGGPATAPTFSVTTIRTTTAVVTTTTFKRK